MIICGLNKGGGGGGVVLQGLWSSFPHTKTQHFSSFSIREPQMGKSMTNCSLLLVNFTWTAIKLGPKTYVSFPSSRVNPDISGNHRVN